MTNRTGVHQGLVPALALLAWLLPPSSTTFAAGSLVVLLRSPAADALSRQSETLLGAELRAAGFAVGEQERTAGIDLRADMEAAAHRLGPIAVVALSPPGDPASGEAEIFLLDRVTGKLVIRRIAPVSGNRPAAAGDLALRAVELLRGSLLEIALPADASRTVEPPPADVSRFVTGGRGVLAVRRAFFVQGLGLGAAATGLGQPGGPGPTYAPALRLSVGGQAAGRERLALRLSLAGLGTAAQAAATDGGQRLGTARMKRSLALLEVLLAFRRDAALQPYAAAGLGVHHLQVNGSGAGSLFADRSGGRLAPALVAGGGVALRLGLQVALLFEAQLLALPSVTPVTVADQEVARVGRPAGLVSVGFTVCL